MYYKKLIDDLLHELSYRSTEGYPILSKKEHQSIISEILTEWGDFGAKEIIMNFLTEGPKIQEADDTGYTHIGAGVYVRSGDVGPDGTAKAGAQKYSQDESGRFSPISEDDYETMKSTQGAEGEDAAAVQNAQTAAQAGGGEAGAEGEAGGEVAQEPEPGSSLKDPSYQDLVKKEKETQEKIAAEKNGKTDKTKESSPSEEEFNKSFDTSISELREKRRKGIAGAGGAVASFGESLYSDNVSSFNFSQFSKENEKEINTEVENIKKKKLNAEQKLVLKNMGYSISPPDEDGLKYLGARKVYFNQQLEAAKKDEDHVFHKDPGFNKEEKPFETWCNAAFDGALSTRQLLENGNEIDTEQPYTCVQSEKNSVDKQVMAELERRRDESKTDEERKHYEREIYFFKKSGEYHDTYIVGKNSKGQMTVVSVTNKAASDLKDPHNNTTPAERLKVLKSKYDKETQETVIGVIEEGITKVTTVTQTTRKNTANIDVDDDFVKLARLAGPKYFKEIDKRGLNRKKTKKGDPVRGAEFGHFLDNENVSVQQWESMGDLEKMKLVQKYNEFNDSAYDPFSKIFIKVGEVNTGGHNQLLKVRQEAEKQGINLNAINIQEAGDIKRNEQSAVKETHENVVNTIYDSDKQSGYPKKDANGNVVENGPAAKAYIDTVLDALHFTSYIDFDDKDDDKLIAQMGIRGAKPSDIRKCLSDLTGYGDIPPGTREGLKEYLRNTSTIDAETGAIVIKSKKNGQETQLAQDSWRTAGTSQKVASSFGTDMQNCVASNVDKRRSSK